MEFIPRQELIVWLTNGRLSKKLRRFGTIIYVSFRMNYVILYVNTAQTEEKIAQISKLSFVKQVEISHRQDLRTDYSESNLLQQGNKKAGANE
ncbi:YlbG family protein [Bombilactobacillus bombi]|uniref:YlbG family protein n=1 Tax=Bombilactobacillus bombi TaxID=1303590 RepID=UPI0015E5D0C9|nr:YlbG family protein [Bombilactobacillus bombi]